MGLRTHYYHQSHGFLPAHCWIIQRTCINEFNFLCTHLSICSFQLFYYPSCLCIFSLYSWSALQSWESGDSAESSSSFLISWNWQCWEKNRPIPLAPTHSEPSTICLNTLKGRQNDPSARLSLPPLWRFGISRSIAVGRLILLGVPACHTLRRYFTLWGHSLVPSLISWGLCLTAGFSIFDAVNDCKHGLMQLNSICLYTVVPWCDKHWLQNIYTIWCILQCCLKIKIILIMIFFCFFCSFYNFYIAILDFSEKHSLHLLTHTLTNIRPVCSTVC